MPIFARVTSKKRPVRVPRGRPPRITRVQNRTHIVDTELVLSITGEVFDGSTPQWGKATGPGTLTSDGGTATLTWTPDEEGPTTFKITLADALGRVAEETFTVTVVPAPIEDRPTIERLSAVPATLTISDNTVDWVVLARSATTDRDEKDGVDDIGAITYQNASSPTRTTASTQHPAITWTGGTPTATGSAVVAARSQWALEADGKGFTLSIATSETDQRVLTIYGGLQGANGGETPLGIKLSAWLSGSPTVKAEQTESIPALTAYAPAAWSITCPPGDEGETLEVKFEQTTSAGNWRIKAFALTENTTPTPTGLSISPDPLATKIHEELVATVTYSATDMTGITITASEVPANGYFVGNADGTGTFVYQAPASVPPDSPVATMTFRAMRGDTQLAELVRPLTVTSVGAGSPPTIECASTWAVTAGQSNSLACTVGAGVTVNFLAAPYAVVYLPSDGLLRWDNPGSARVGSHSLVLEAVDAQGRRSTKTVTITVSE